ncbi:MAG: ribosome biogenesis GTP-binding protein YihA/YsxC [Acidobacteriota bacterium]|nr:ribosome biogenesis GTP-binding protein YihA/YsxC [Acidobacteriota bacterium]
MPKAPRDRALFVTSAVTRAGFPATVLPEVAFVGRSNVGKSSLLNRLAGQRGLAHVSRTPGRTRMVNFFEVPGRYRLVDLPGYGYARAPEALRRGWEDLVLGYLTGRESLVLNLLLVDARRDPLANDLKALELLSSSGRPVAVVATKMDKLKSSQAALRLRQLSQAFGSEGEVPVIPCSTLASGKRPRDPGREGVGKVRQLIAERVEAWR